MTAVRERQRLFFALWPDEASQQKIDKLNQQLLHQGQRLTANNLHITLLFLGYIDKQWYEPISKAVASVRADSLSLCFDELLYWRKPRVLCLGYQRQTMPLYRLLNQLHQKMRPFPIRLESRPFRAHITLARKVKERPEHARFTPIRMEFDQFALVESVSSAQGVNYIPRQYWPLSTLN